MIRLLFVFLVLAFSVSSASASAETCIASAPNGSSLRIYDAPSTSAGVLGGIGVGTCGITVTNQCEGAMCVITLPGLNGWADMRHISNSPVQAPGLMNGPQGGGSYTYAVVGGSGTVTAAGITQPTPVDATGSVRIEASSATSATLFLPREVTDAPVRLTGQGTGPWTGGFGSWGGMPMGVSVTFNGLGDQTARLVLEGANQIASMKISLDLSARALPSNQQSGAANAGSGVPQAPSPAPSAQGAGSNACADLERITRIINRQAGTRQIQDMRGIYVIAGVKGTGPADDQAACARALDLIAQDEGLWKLAENGLGAGAGTGQATPVPAPRPNPGGQQAGSGASATPAVNPQGGVSVGGSTASPPQNGELLAQACVILQPVVSPLLRGQSRSNRETVLAILSAQGVVSVASAQSRQCALVMAELVAVGLIVNDTRPWLEIANSNPGGGGEDPATMIAGGVEIGIDPSDFIPEFDPSGQQGAGTGNSTVAVSGQEATAACLELGDAMIVTIRLGFAGDLETFSQILKKHRVETLAPSATQACARALDEARQAGLAR
ncbi:hypothetical protein [Roseibium sp. MMSF_3544]|uniref:hypothetical protein n=1 Tax=unclassified Roseibium TaxID=2629323 RepID=UPI00273DA0EB|nr:hypothetical protein [Roseibium sp. MMSF_3544]